MATTTEKPFGIENLENFEVFAQICGVKYADELPAYFAISDLFTLRVNSHFRTSGKLLE